MIQLMEAVIDDGLAIRNVAAKTKKPIYNPAEKDPLTEQEIDWLLDADLAAQDRLLVLLGLFKGLL